MSDYLTQIFTTYKKKIDTTIHKICKTNKHASVEDVSQDVYETLVGFFRNMTPDPSLNLDGYIYKVVKHATLESIEKEKRYYDVRNLFLHSAKILYSKQFDADDMLLSATIESLFPKKREILIIRLLLSGYTFQEVATAAGCCKATISEFFTKAVKKIVEEIK